MKSVTTRITSSGHSPIPIPALTQNLAWTAAGSKPPTLQIEYTKLRPNALARSSKP